MRPVLLLAALGLVGCSTGTTPQSYAAASFALQAVPAPATPQPTGPVRTDSNPPGQATPKPVASTSGGTGGGGSGGGGSGGGSVAAGTVTGQVIGLGGASPQPLAGATVRTSDGRSATTDAQGDFSIAGALPQGGQLIASANGYAASAVTGLPTSGNFTLHLRAQATSEDSSLTESHYPMLLKGKVVDGNGHPAAHVTVTLSDSHGSVGTPTLTNSGGQFSLSVDTPDSHVVNGTLIALGDGDYPWMGVATGIQADLGHEIVDFDPTSPGKNPLKLVSAGHRLKVDLTGTGSLTPHSYVSLVAADGTALAVAFASDGALVANIPGTHYALDASDVDGMNGLSSRVHVEPLPIDFTTPETEASAALLPPPDVTATAVAPGSQVSWTAVPGATGYRVILSSNAGLLWEGFTTGTSMALSEPALDGQGPYGLTVLAWDDAAVDVRSVMGLQRLQVLPLSKSYRQSQMFLQFTQ
ncbi:MAG TPA: carboxypeptidase-like regulatory domain-containing protein [Oscillatoriaceae cyanobacterium]